MKKLIFTLSLILCLTQLMRVRAQISPAFGNRLQFVLDSVCSKYRIKGVTAAVLIPGSGIWKGTYGESHEEAPVTADMLMGMGSNTKTHISALLLKMQEESLISLDDTIGEWIRGYPNINGQITIRQLLNHTSGLFDYMQNDAINDSIFGNFYKIWKPEEILWLAKVPNFEPGAGWSYSNTNYIIAGIIIQKVLNKTPEAAMKEMILAPNGLNNTFFYGEQTTQIVAHPWTLSLSGTDMADLRIQPFPLQENLFSLASTAGNMITTAEDNVMFWHKLITGQIISDSSLKEMTTCRSIGSNQAYGLGIFRYNKGLNGRTFYSHGGTFFGFINENMADTTSGVCISVLTNQDSIGNSRLLTSVIGALHKVSIIMKVTGVEDAVYNNPFFRMYPNPASEKIYVNADQPNAIISIYDLNGKEQLREQIRNGDQEVSIEYLPAGLYIACIKDDSGRITATQKLQVVK